MYFFSRHFDTESTEAVWDIAKANIIVLVDIKAVEGLQQVPRIGVEGRLDTAHDELWVCKYVMSSYFETVNDLHHFFIAYIVP